MKAYMSDPSLSEAGRCYERDAHHMGAPACVIAEREARSILADVEPLATFYVDGCPHANQYDFYPHGHGMKDTRTALAEALARFVS